MMYKVQAMTHSEAITAIETLNKLTTLDDIQLTSNGNQWFIEATKNDGTITKTNSLGGVLHMLLDYSIPQRSEHGAY